MAEKLLIPYLRQSRKKEVTISLDEQRAAIGAWAEREGGCAGARDCGAGRVGFEVVARA